MIEHISLADAHYCLEWLLLQNDSIIIIFVELDLIKIIHLQLRFELPREERTWNIHIIFGFFFISVHVMLVDLIVSEQLGLAYSVGCD